LLGSPAAASAQNLGRPTVGPTGVSDISDMTGMNCVIEKMKSISHWIGLGKIYRKPWFLPSNIGLSCKFSHNPIL
jgi:hypothetical protein